MRYNLDMSVVLEQLSRRPVRVAKTDDFTLARPDTELRRLSDRGVVLRLAKGYYALVPEGRRGPGTEWRPSIEAVGLGIAAALHGVDKVSLLGPSAARIHECYPRALGQVHVAVPAQHRNRETPVGMVRFVKRDVTKIDTVRAETDLGAGWVTSIEQTALDLCRDRPAWYITDTARPGDARPARQEDRLGPHRRDRPKDSRHQHLAAAAQDRRRAVIDPDEIAAIAERFGAPEPQVVRDHLISHMLFAFATLPGEIAGPTMFLGGTALCRTWCPDIRLSEDIDVLAASPEDIEPMLTGLSRGLRREFPARSWTAEGVHHQVDSRLLQSASSIVRVQFHLGPTCVEPPSRRASAHRAPLFGPFQRQYTSPCPPQLGSRR